MSEAAPTFTSTPTPSASPSETSSPYTGGGSNNTNNNPLGGQPLSFAIIPLAILAVAAAISIFLCVRRRRRTGSFGWTGVSDADVERANRNTARPRRGQGRQWAVWRTDEGLGLDEHGEAPPAYEPKARPGQSLESGMPVRGDTTAALHTYELDQMRRPDDANPDAAATAAAPDPTTASASSSSSPSSSGPSPAPGSPAVTSPAPAHAEPPPPEYDSVTAGSTPPPPTAPHPAGSPIITAPPPAVSFWGRRR